MIKWLDNNVLDCISKIKKGELLVVFNNHYMSIDLLDGHIMAPEGSTERYVFRKINENLDKNETAFFVFLETKNTMSGGKMEGNIISLVNSSKHIAYTYKASLLNERYAKSGIVRTFKARRATKDEFEMLKKSSFSKYESNLVDGNEKLSNSGAHH